ncbi:MAG: type I methionyl aminopeptidase [Deltaproteobacteria bacterium]
MVPIKNSEELEIMRQAGRLLAQVLHEVAKSVAPGKTTGEIDGLAERLIRDAQAIPAFKGYRGYPGTLCTSVNNEVIHGIPGGRRLEEGDIISLDCGLIFRKYYSDMAVTVPVGRISADAQKLIRVTRDSLTEGIKKARPGNRLSDISHAVQEHVEKNGFSVVRQFVGHGIGSSLHEEPEVPNFGRPGRGVELKPGMVLAVEPMVNMGTWECLIMDDGWTAVTKDGKLSAHFEHTIAITDGEAQILTKE